MKFIRVSFLPMFFVCLSIVMIAAIAYRIHSYEDESQDRIPVPQHAPKRDALPPEKHVSGEKAVVTAPSAGPSVVRPHQRDLVNPILEQPGPADEVSRLVERAWFEPRAIRSGQHGNLILLTRMGSEISGLSAILQSPMGTARVPLQCVMAAESHWRCTVAVPACVACGRWSVREVQLNLRSGGRVKVPASHRLIASLGIHISANQCDSTPPRLSGLSIGQTDVAEDGTGGDFLFTLNVADDYCGLAAITGVTESSRGQQVSFAAASTGDENFWAARQEVTRATDRGLWKVSSVELTDIAGNVSTYTASDAPLKEAIFEIP